MTSTPNGPKKPYKTPFGRRLKYLFQDSGYAAKKAARKVADPVRDAKSRPAGPKATAGKKAASAKPAAARRKAAPPRRPKDSTGARELGERPVAPRRRAERKPRAERREKSARRRRPRVGFRARRRAEERKPRRRRREARPRRKLPNPSASGIAAAITRFGERSSRVIRGAVAPLGPPLRRAGGIGRRLGAWLAEVVTPLRAALLATGVAAILLGVSQFVDYRGVAVGVTDYAAYADAEIVAPAPQVDRDPTGSAHAYLLLPVAAAALVLLALCARGRWQFGWVVALLGLFTIAVSLIVDVAAGLDESVQAVAYEGVEARLIEGFYAQLSAGAVLVAGGVLVARYARRSTRKAPRPRRRAAAVGPARASAT